MREVTAYNWVPDFAQGFVKDLRVRWALEEAGLSYTQRLIDHEQKVQAGHLSRQPFAQVPVYRDDTADLFESGAIVLRIASGSLALMPEGAAAQARVSSWIFAALNSVEPYVANVQTTELFDSEADWAPGFLEIARQRLSQRMTRLSDWLEAREYLEAGRFTAGDLMMATVLRDLERGEMLARFPVIDAYLARCLSRPAFRRAHEAQLAAFSGQMPG
ncbi:glutathione S-transferase family protein [Hyphomonas sp.]|uniref:glutathione S-transferase family protein n=1 Tax=Hyphomonas sp. TaxID=87 RepID=UPI00391B259D